MSAQEIGSKLVELCREGKNLEAIDQYYAPDVVSEEVVGMPELPRVMNGIDAVRGKNEWWFANHEVHSGEVRGPFPNGDEFSLIFNYDVTPTAGPMAGQRMQMEEVGVYTVKDGKIAKEKFYYAVGE